MKILFRSQKFMLFMATLMLFSCNKVYQKENVEQLEPTAYLEKLHQSSDYYLLDIRTPMEYRKNHIEDAQNINFLGFSFGKKINKLDKDKTVFIYCETAHRSPMVAKKLQKKGFRHIVDLAGGHKALRKLKP